MNGIEKKELKFALEQELSKLVEERKDLLVQRDTSETCLVSHRNENQTELLIYDSDIQSEISDNYIQEVWDKYHKEFKEGHEDLKQLEDELDNKCQDCCSRITEIDTRIGNIRSYIQNNLN